MIFREFLLLVFILFFSNLAQSKDYLDWGKSFDSKTCELSESLVIEVYDGSNSCISYYKSDNTSKKRKVIVEIYGDRSNYIGINIEEIPNNTKGDQIKAAKYLSSLYGHPVILLSRPGVYGSSGDHRERRTRKEYDIVMKAINELVNRYKIEEIYLIGQSGGATAIAGAFTLGLSGIDCAILTSGAYGLAERANYHRVKNGRPTKRNMDTTGRVDFHDPLFYVKKITDNSFNKLIIAGDPRDKNTPFYLQERFFKKIKEERHNVSLIKLEALPSSYHGYKSSSRAKLISECEN